MTYEGWQMKVTHTELPNLGGKTKKQKTHLHPASAFQIFISYTKQKFLRRVQLHSPSVRQPQC